MHLIFIWLTGFLIGFALFYTLVLLALAFSKEGVAKAWLAVLVYALTAIYLIVSPFVVLVLGAMIVATFIWPVAMQWMSGITRTGVTIGALLLPQIVTLALKRLPYRPSAGQTNPPNVGPAAPSA